jgi:hypothetical protein
MIRALGLAVVILTSFSSSAADPCAMQRQNASALPYSAGEELSYRMEVRGVSAGRAHFQLGGLERTPYGIGYPIRADIETNAYAAFVGDMAGQLVSILDPRSQQSRYYRFRLQQQKSVISDRAVRNKDTIRFTHAKGSRKKEGALRGSLIDPVQLLYGLRDLRLQKGQQVCLRMYAYSRLNRLRGRVIGKETIDTAAGSVDAWRVELFLKRGAKSYPLHLWVGPEASRPLWRAELHHPKGVLSVHLDRHILGGKSIFRL